MQQFNKVVDSGKRQEFGTGAVRDTQEGKGRFDLLPYYAITRLAQHFENGSQKYGDDNWRKGIPLRRYLDSMMRHAFKFMAGMKDEDHLSAIMWNSACLLETQEMIRIGLLPKELDNLPASVVNEDASTELPESDVLITDEDSLSRGMTYVPKGWGSETWMTNNHLYCGKILKFNKHKQCSWHYHVRKDETFFLQSGRLRLTYGNVDDITQAKTIILVPETTFHVPPGMRHQMFAEEDSILLETSTQHLDSDSIRVTKGD